MKKNTREIIHSKARRTKKKKRKIRDGDVRNICDGGSFERIGGETLQEVEE